MTPELLDRIYECSFAPELWPDALSRISQVVGAVGANLSIIGQPDGEFTFNTRDGYFWAPSFDPGALIAAMMQPRMAAEAFFTRLNNASRYSFESDHTIFAPEEYETVPILSEVFVPAGMKWGAGTCFTPPIGAIITLGMRRVTDSGPLGAGELDQLNALRPHIGRATLVAARLHAERAQAAAQALAALGLPALVCDRMGVVCAANALVEEMSELVWLVRDRFSFLDRLAQQQFDDALAAIEADESPSVRSFPVRNAQGAAAGVAHLLPIRRSARDIFARSSAALFLTPLAAPRAPAADLVRSLFDFTSSEASVAVGLAQGKTVEDLAADWRVSPSTIRTHVRRVLEKTGSRRQTDAALLLVGLDLAGPAKSRK